MEFKQTLLQWFREYGRELPWRATNDPYAIWLSEIILQQTRVAQGKAYWQRFISTWKTYEELANATEDEVLKAWQGLGYYSRARNLHKAAKQLLQMGGFPSDYQSLKKLKGVGDYTAAAIASIAFGEPVAVVDGNVYRVLSRYFGVDTPIDSTAGKKQFWELAQQLIDTENPASYNQAIMDFGAILCTPQSPLCTDCPLADACVAFNEGRIAQLPVKTKKIKQRERFFSYVYIRCQNSIAIRQRGGKDIWQGLWELPQISDIQSLEALGSKNNPTVFSSQNSIKSSRELSASAPLTEVCKGVKHVLTHQILYADLYLWLTDERPILPEGFIWIPETDIEKYALPRLIEILLQRVKPLL